MNKKRSIQMIIVIIFILLLALFRNGIFSDSNSLKETFTSPDMKKITSSRNWTYLVSKEKGSDIRPYFINKKEHSVKGQPIIKGIYFYEENGKIRGDVCKEELFVLRYFLLGEKRWIRKSDVGSETKYVIIKIEWVYDEKKYSEVLKSDIFNDDDVKKFKEILRKYKIDKVDHKVISESKEYKDLLEKVKSDK